MAESTSGTSSRIVEVLTTLAEDEHDGTLSSIAKCVGLPPSTVHRMLHLLSEHGVVRYDERRRLYAIGPELYRISALVVSKLGINDIARPVLQRIVADLDETAALSLYVPEEHSMMFAELVDSTKPLRYAIPLYRHMPLAWGASGRCILAFLPDEERHRAFEQSKPSPVSGAEVDVTDIERDLELTRERGYALSHGQKIDGAVGIGVPVWAANGRVVAGLCVTIPEMRFQAGHEEAVAELLGSYGRELSGQLGYSGDYPAGGS